MTIHRVPLVVLGWCGLILFAISDVVARGGQDLVFMAGVACLAAVMAIWVWSRPARPALIVSAALGAFVTLAQAIYVFMDVTYLDAVNAVIDSIGLAAGIGIALGAITALATRQANARTAPSQ